MKSFVAMTVFILSVILLFSSCTVIENENSSSNAMYESQTQKILDATAKDEDTPNDFMDFDSYSEYLAYLNTQKTNASTSSVNGNIAGTNSQITNADSSKTFGVPCQNGNLIPLKDQEGYSCITHSKKNFIKCLGHGFIVRTGRS